MNRYDQLADIYDEKRFLRATIGKFQIVQAKTEGLDKVIRRNLKEFGYGE